MQVTKTNAGGWWKHDSNKWWPNYTIVAEISPQENIVVVNLKVIFKTLDNDVIYYVTTKRRHPKASNNTIKNLGAHFKGQSPRFYIVPSETI